jgi:hypothetical protein
MTTEAAQGLAPAELERPETRLARLLAEHARPLELLLGDDENKETP